MKVGYAFGDHIHTEHRSRLQFRRNSDGERDHAIRWIILPIVLCIGVVFLIGKLFVVQVLDGNTYRLISDKNRVRTQLIHAPRGIIFDRNGQPLVYNSPGFRETVNGKTKVISQKDAIPLLAKGDKNLEVDSLRNYAFKDILGHITGYIGEISPDELKKTSAVTYKPGDLYGKMGIEAEYEDTLRGVDGQKLIEVDAFGKPVRTLGQTDPIPGQDITLSIDSKLQQSVVAAMKNVVHGAVIVSTPKGEILAMVSKPLFDPNMFTLGTGYTPSTTSGDTSIQSLLTDSENHPLLNRAIGGVYPPGSTFKLVVGAAGLEDHVIDQNYTVTDTGVITVGKFSYANWFYTEYNKTEVGPVDIITALKRSNDIYFYRVGEKLGVDRLSEAARNFGAGRILGIDLPGEVSGTVPTKEWKKKTFGENWYLGDDFHFGIGQGYLLTTPLQVNAWTQAIANKGDEYAPHMLKDSQPVLLHSHLLTDKTHTLLQDGMIAVCSPGGVAWPLFNFMVKNPALVIDGKNFQAPTASSSADVTQFRQVSVACKTGTAQQGGDAALPHGWITLYAPAYNPQVIITVLNEDSGEGSNTAAPVAKDILTAWFTK